MMSKLFFLLVFLFSIHTLFAQNDTLIMNNGNMIVGEIKNMSKNILQIETDFSDSDFKIEWDKVREIKSNRTFIFFSSDSRQFDGSIKMDKTDSTRVILYNNNREIKVDFMDLVFIKAVEHNFLGRLSFELSAGYTLTKANNLNQFSIRSGIGYLSKTFSADASFNAVRNVQDKVEPIKRTEASIGFRYLIVNDWFALISSNLLQNDEQKIKLRATTSGGIGNYIVSNNKIYFGVAAGLAWNNERYTETTDEDRNSLEALGGVELNLFNFGDLSLLTNLLVYPSITEKGRVRADYNIDLKYDLPLDFFISLGFTYNFDNQPVTDASKSDYVFQTTVGWEL